MVVARAVQDMTFGFDEALPVLGRTPGALHTLLHDLPAAWTNATEGPNTWSPFDVVGHLIHAERTDWVPRVEHILQHGDAVPFPAFDREAMFTASRGLSLAELLDTFDRLRTQSLARLTELRLTDADLARRGLHPQFGVVTMDQHLATWVAHDLGHISQVVRVMARQYTDAVGPWRAYLSDTGPRTGIMLRCCSATACDEAIWRTLTQVRSHGGTEFDRFSRGSSLCGLGASVATSLRSQS